MTWYQLLLFMHITGAVLWVGGAAMMQFFGLRAMASGSDERLVHFAGDIEWIGFRVLLPFSALAFFAGLGLVWNAAFWHVDDDWVLIGLGLFGLTFLAGLLFFGPEGGRIEKLIAAEGASSPVVQARIKRMIVLTRIDLVLLLLIAFDMVVKPSFSDGRTIIGALVGAAVLSTLLVLLGRSAPAAAMAE
jgi:uncharacterized membrane protein